MTAFLPFFFSFWPVHIFFYDLLWSYSFRGPQKYRPHYRLIERGRPPHCQCAFPSSKGHWTLACRSAEESPGSGPPPLLAPSPVFPISAPIEKSPGASLETESRTCLKITRNDLLFLSHPVISWVTFLRLTVSVSNSPPFFYFLFCYSGGGGCDIYFLHHLKESASFRGSHDGKCGCLFICSQASWIQCHVKLYPFKRRIIDRFAAAQVWESLTLFCLFLVF